MSFIWYFKPEFKAPYRSDDVEESCVLAYNYFSTLVDYFVEKLPEDRLPFESDDDEPTLADRVHLIFPNGFGELNDENNHNPYVWPVLLALCDAVHERTTEAFANELCDSWEGKYDADGRCKDQIKSLQNIFDWITSYLQDFVVLSDADSINLDFKYPPEDECGILIGSKFRKSDLMSKIFGGFGP